MRIIQRATKYTTEDFFRFFTLWPKQDILLFQNDSDWYLCPNPRLISRVVGDLQSSVLQRQINTIEERFEKRKKSFVNMVSQHVFPGGLLALCDYQPVLNRRKQHGTEQAKTLFFNVENLLRLDTKSGEVSIIGEPFEVDYIERSIKKMIRNRRLPQYSLGPFSRKYPQYVWQQGFKKTIDAISKGEVYQLNLTEQFFAPFAGSTRALFCEMIRRIKPFQGAYLKMSDQTLMSCSPESFLRYNGTAVVTEPIKGTAARGKTRLEDERLFKQLLDSPKESAELLMITDLLRNDLRQFAQPGSVRVDKLRELQKTPYVWHTFSRITAELAPGVSQLKYLLAALPGGSIAGCPKQAATEIIDLLEPHRREMFCGVLAIFGYNEIAESSILIRSLVAQKSTVTLQAGCGITIDSARQNEADELMAKAQPFFDLANASATK